MKDDSTNPDASSNHPSSIIDHQCPETILAVSSPIGGPRSILRLSGPETLPACRRVFTTPISLETNGILAGSVAIEGGLTVDALLYLFFAPHSYTGEDLAELHVYASPVLVEALVQQLLSDGVRAAGPGEFTARAYLNGKLDLAQAEAVNEIIAGSNRFQLNAAKRLLSGALTRSTEAIRAALLDCLSLIEAGLDFSGEEIEFISAEQAAERLSAIVRDLEELLAGSIRYESLLELPSVGIAGAPNAGKSSLLNALLGQERSLVSEQPRTTRDVLSGLLSVVPTGLDRVASGADQASSVPASDFTLQTSNSIQCVLFDCAGLLAAPDNVLDRLAQQAAIEALQHCSVVLFCVDAAKADWSEDLSIRALVESQTVLHLATKADLLPPETQPMAMKKLSELFQAPFLPISSKTGEGLDELRARLASSLTAQSAAGHADDVVAMTTRHKQRVCEALDHVGQAQRQIECGGEEVAATLIRTAHEALAEIGQQPLDEQVLDRIFSRFCIGK